MTFLKKSSVIFYTKLNLHQMFMALKIANRRLSKVFNEIVKPGLRGSLNLDTISVLD